MLDPPRGTINGNFLPEIDFEPFNVSFPRPTLSKSIGNGVEFLNRHISAKCFMTEIACTRYLIFSKNTTGRKVNDYLSALPPTTLYAEFYHRAETAERVLEMIRLLLDFPETLDSCTLENFLGRVCMVFNVIILSPLGYCVQNDLLGYPDTSGEPWRERCLKRIKQQEPDITPQIVVVTRLLPDAVGTSCSQRLEKVFGDLGMNDGNLVASLLSHTQCTIAHALEKTKYPDSELYMEKFAAKYHFACQFTADLIAINDTDLSSLVLLQRISGRYKHQPFIAFKFNLFWYVHFPLISITEPFTFVISART
ncbi:hypothetical protein MKW98_020333 [Papaver atlanticum]|uniref:sucrose synthase n=1 Tax=Papaver atlanticum TaxID=357466 RepID=A0AAD4RVH0_9MAGN|nr:hypothetical protein MKW98_020333 [Papaver atlanticum]